MAPKWKEKDKKVLYEKVREKFIQLIKLKLNVIRVDPMVKIKKKQEKLLKKKESEIKRVERRRKEKEQ